METALQAEMDDIEALANKNLAGESRTLEEARQELVAKIGENIKLRRIKQMQVDGVIGQYLHGSKIGVLVAVKNGDESLAT